jgi:peptidoglycan/LPS O-acetylase OafA/YrhL
MHIGQPMSLTQPTRAGRIPQLDVLRGLAILMVMWSHLVIPPEHAGFMAPVAEFGVLVGSSGVDLFFVLSGFLIGGLLFKELRHYGRLNVGRFWIRRGMKIWPGYYALMLVTFIRLRRQMGSHAAAAFVLPSLFTLQNYLRSAAPHTWSLAVEEHFYLLLPLLLAFLPRPHRAGRMVMPSVPIICLLLGITGLVLRLLLLKHHPTFHLMRTDPTQYNIDGMFFGVFLAYLFHFHFDLFSAIARRRVLLLLGLFMLSPMCFASRWFITGIGHTLTYFGYGLLLMVLVQIPLGRGLLGRLLNSRAANAVEFIGFYSYAIYLWFPVFVEDPMFYWLEHHAVRMSPGLLWLLSMSAYFATAILIGIVLSKLIEFPILALRNRWFPPRASMTTSSQPATPP